jgi:hypothetical protein
MTTDKRGRGAKRPSLICHGLIEHQLASAVNHIVRDPTAFNHSDVEYSLMICVLRKQGKVLRAAMWAT